MANYGETVAVIMVGRDKTPDGVSNFLRPELKSMRRFAMKKHLLMLTTSAFILACGPIAASAQQSPGTPTMQQPADSHSTHHPDQQQSQQQPNGQENPGMMGHGGMMGRGMMGDRGMMGHGMMGRGMIMRMIFALMDADGDGTVSLQEFQAAHERIFRAMDSNKDGRLTLEEMQAFMHGSRQPVPQR